MLFVRIKKINLYFLILIIFYGYNSFYSQWRNIGPGGGSDLQAILIQPNNPNVVFIGGDIEGIIKTTNGGESWEMVNSNLALESWTPDIYWVNQLSYDLTDTSYKTIFYCSAIGLFKTTDGAKNWKKIFPTVINSEDDFVNVFSIAQNPKDFKSIFIGTENKGLFKSTDAGINWEKVSLPIADPVSIFKIIFIPDSNLILATSQGVLQSKNSGKSWNVQNSGLPNNYVWNMQYVSNNNNPVLFCTLATFGINGNKNSFSGGIFKSTDLGNSWVNITGNLPKMQSDGLFYFYWKLAVNPLNPNTIFVGTSVGYPDESLGAYEDWGIYKTTNGGSFWFKTDNNLMQAWMDSLFFDERHALLLAIARADTNVIYWGRDWMNKTTDGGNSWFQIYSNKINGGWKTRGMELMMVEGMSFSPVIKDKFYVGYDDMGPFVTTDGGNSFKNLDKVMDPYDGYDAAKEILIDPANGDIYISRYDGLGSAEKSGYSLGKIYFSSDDGKTFNNISNGFPDGRPMLVADFKNGKPGQRTLFACSYGNGIFKSTDSGQNWTGINNGLGADAPFAWTLALNPQDSREIYVGLNKLGNGSGMYKTTDGGANWFKLNNFPDYDVLTIKIDTIKNIVYSGATSNFDWSIEGGIYKSTDRGKNWTKIWNYPRVKSIAISTDNPDVLYAAAQPWYSVWQPSFKPGIYQSTDGGTGWKNITQSLGHTFVTFVKVNPFNPAQLFVGTGGGGLWVNDNVTSAAISSKNSSKKYFSLKNFPNPFNPATNILFTLPIASNVKLEVFNVLGEKVLDVVNKYFKRGNYRIHLNMNGFSAGIYYVRLIANNYFKSIKIVLLK